MSADDLDRLRSPSGIYVLADGAFAPPRHPRQLRLGGARRPLQRGDELLLGEVELLRESGQLTALLGSVLTETRPSGTAQETDEITFDGMADPEWEAPDEDDSGAPAQVARKRNATRPMGAQAAPPGFHWTHEGVMRNGRR